MLSSVTRSILFWLLVSSGFALLWPESVGFDPFVISKWWIWSLITLTMFCLGSLVRSDELKPLRSKPWWVGLGVVTQMVAMPLAAWGVTKLVPMDPELAAGVILVGCVPGAMASNVLTHTAGGNVAYSVSLTTVATLLSPVSVPLVLRIFAVKSDEPLMNPTETSALLLLTVVLPAVAGYACTRMSTRWQVFASRWAPTTASICLLWIIASVVAGNRETLLGVALLLVMALLAINLAGYVSGYAVGRVCGLPSSFRRALTLEVGMQNAGLGTALAGTLYGAGTLATIPTAVYTFGCMLTGTVLAVFWREFRKDGSSPDDSTGPQRGEGDIM